MTDLLTDRAVSFIADKHENLFSFTWHIRPFTRRLNKKTIRLSIFLINQNIKRRVVILVNIRKRYGRDKKTTRTLKRNLTSRVNRYCRRPWLSRILIKWVRSGMRFLDKNTSEETIQDRAEMLLAVDEAWVEFLQNWRDNKFWMTQ